MGAWILHFIWRLLSCWHVGLCLSSQVLCLGEKWFLEIFFQGLFQRSWSRAQRPPTHPPPGNQGERHTTHTTWDPNLPWLPGRREERPMCLRAPELRPLWSSGSSPSSFSPQDFCTCHGFDLRCPPDLHPTCLAPSYPTDPGSGVVSRERPCIMLPLTYSLTLILSITFPYCLHAVITNCR